MPPPIRPRGAPLIKRRHPRTISDPDLALWAAYASQVRALPGRAALPPVPAVPPKTAEPPAPPTPAPVSARPTPRGPRANVALAAGQAPAGLDRATWQRFAGGKMPTERRLDLHGRTVEAAYHALLGFLGRARAEGVRTVEIITGLGSGDRGGVIRHELPHWLNQPNLRPHILAASYPNARNHGAVRLLLRR